MSRRASVHFQATGLSLLTGALYAALLPPLSLAPLAWVALVPWLVAVTRVSPLAAAAYGLLATLVGTVGVAWWFPSMVQGFFEASPTASLLGLLGLAIGVNAAPYAALGAWLSWRTQRGPVGPGAVAAAWVLAEWTRANAFPVPNPFALIAYSQVETPFAQLADLAGPYGIGMLVVAVNAALAGGLAPALAGARPARARLAVAAACALAFAYGGVRLSQDFAIGEPVRVALVQGAVVRPPKWDVSTRDANLAAYLDLTRQASSWQPEVVFWPEYGVDFYLNERTRWRRRLMRSVRQLDADLVTGGAHYARGEERTRYFNSVFLIDRGGEVTDRYDKLRLVPFSEYGPLGDWLRADTAVYEPGDAPRVLGARTVAIGAFVCAEALFPEVARELSRRGAELLANPSNDYWFGHPAAQRHQLEIASLRAVENRRYLVRPTSTGFSAVIDAHGRITRRSGIGAPEVIEGEVRRSRARTAYQLWGDGPVAVAFVWVLLGSVPRRRVGTDREVL